MPDISMCPSEDCPVRRGCYRNEASGTRPNPWRQAWADWTWGQPANGGSSIACEGYWPDPMGLPAASAPSEGHDGA
jgi:hypothetical protein